MKSKTYDYDLCVIGGGINGCGIARDAAGRGLKVLLLEKDDLACATSSASSKLIHGGLRYLEFYEFKLVREALWERKVLLQSAPHIIWPLEFILPHHKDLRPVWMIRLGLFLYDFLAGSNNLKKSKGVDLRSHKAGTPLGNQYTRGFRYSDAWVQDSRLVLANALDAAERGADILTYTECTNVKADGDLWHVTYRGRGDDVDTQVSARAVINASGPWVDQFLQNCGLKGRGENLPHVRLVKGSHIIVPRQHDGDQAYILQQKDGRIVFVLPYEEAFTLIGTTEENYEGDPMDAAISDAETQYLLRAFNDSFKAKIAAKDIVHSFSGVRPLFDDGQADAKAVTRDYRFHVHEGAAPMISVYGGKLTTYRKLSEGCVNTLLHLLEEDLDPWTADAKLPGAQERFANHEEMMLVFGQKYPFLPADLLRRYVKNYGDRAQQFLDGKASLDQLGIHYGDGIYEAELDHMMKAEGARELNDALWRRSKMLLHSSKETQQKIARAMAEKLKDIE